MALGLSNSAPGVEIAPWNHNEIDDICWYLRLTMLCKQVNRFQIHLQVKLRWSLDASLIQKIS